MKDAEDVLVLLERDHREVESLFQRAEGDPSAFEEIRDALTAHATVEEEILYPAVRTAMAEEQREMVDEAFHDHADVKQMLSEIASLSAGETEFSERLTELRDAVQGHVEEEEGEMFPTVRSLLTPGVLADLGCVRRRGSRS